MPGLKLIQMLIKLASGIYVVAQSSSDQIHMGLGIYLLIYVIFQTTVTILSHISDCDVDGYLKFRKKSNQSLNSIFMCILCAWQTCHIESVKATSMRVLITL